MRTSSKKTWKTITPLDIEIETKTLLDRELFPQELTVVTSSGIRLQKICTIFEKDECSEMIPPMILEENDFNVVKEQFRELSSAEKIQRVITINSFFTHYPNTKIYMRTIGYNKNGDDRLVFTTEALEFVRVVMKRTNKSVWRWRSFAKRWQACNSLEERSGYATMTLPKFARLLKEFAIDPTLFTLVPDFEFAHQSFFIGNFIGLTQPMVFWGPRSRIVLHETQHMFAIFTEVVLAVDWSTHLRCSEPGCRQQFRESIITALIRYSKSDATFYQNEADFPKYLTALKSMCYYRMSGQVWNVSSLLFTMFDSTDRMRLCYFLSLCEKMGFASGPSDLLERFHEMHLPLWKVRALFMILFADKFFDNESRLDHLKKVIHKTITLKIPGRHWNHPDDSSILDILLSSDPEILETERQAAVCNATEIECLKTYHKNRVGEREENDEPVDSANFMLCLKWPLVGFVGTVLKEPTPENSRDLRIMLNDYKKMIKEKLEMNKERDDEMTRKTNEVLRKVLIEKAPIDSLVEPQEASAEQEEAESELMEPDPAEILELFSKFEKRTLLQWKHVRELRRLVKSTVEVHRSEEYRKELKSTQKMPYYTNCKPSTSNF